MSSKEFQKEMMSIGREWPLAKQIAELELDLMRLGLEYMRVRIKISNLRHACTHPTKYLNHQLPNSSGTWNIVLRCHDCNALLKLSRERPLCESCGEMLNDVSQNEARVKKALREFEAADKKPLLWRMKAFQCLNVACSVQIVIELVNQD